MSVRTRLIAAVILAGASAGAGIALERYVGPRLPAETPAEGARSGAWLCPHGGGKDWSAWVVLANHGDAPVEARVTTFSNDAEPTVVDEQVPAEGLRYVAVQAPTMAAGSLVEFFGTDVAAGMGVVRPGAAGTASEPCAPSPGRTWYVPGGSTVRGRNAWLVVMNPFAVDAAFEVTVTAKGRALQPGPLRGVVLPAYRSVAFDLNRFFLGEPVVAATVRSSLGRVAVAGLGLGERGVHMVLGVRALATRWVLPGPGDDNAPGALAILSGRRETPFRAAAQADASQDFLTDVSVPALRTDTFEVPAAGKGLSVAAEGKASFAAARRIERTDLGDQAAESGTSEPAASWIVLPAGPAEAGPGRLLLENPGTETVTLSVMLLAAEGSVPAPDLAALTVGPGQTQEVDLSTLTDQPVAALVQAREGSVVAAQTVAWPGGFAVSLGTKPGIL